MAKKGKLPKRIAGVKIPKKLRKRGGPLYALMEKPMVRNVVADLLASYAWSHLLTDRLDEDNETIRKAVGTIARGIMRNLPPKAATA